MVFLELLYTICLNRCLPCDPLVRAAFSAEPFLNLLNQEFISGLWVVFAVDCCLIAPAGREAGAVEFGYCVGEFECDGHGLSNQPKALKIGDQRPDHIGQFCDKNGIGVITSVG